MTIVEPRRSLDMLRPEVEALNHQIAALDERQWALASNCPGWAVADLAAHVVRNAESVLRFVERTLSGDPTPCFGPTWKPREEEIRALGPAGCAQLQGVETEDLIAQVSALSEADLQRTNLHPAGPRTIAWMCTQRLAEAAYHHWDLRQSLGEQGPLEAGTGDYLLRFLLDPALPSVVRQHVDGGGAASFRLTTTSDGTSWRVSGGPGETRRVELGSQGPADVEITAEPGWLALAVYGRAGIDQPAFTVRGTADAPRLFAASFGGR